jgi:hypothetical protein
MANGVLYSLFPLPALAPLAAATGRYSQQPGHRPIRLQLLQLQLQATGQGVSEQGAGSRSRRTPEVF